MNTKQKETSMIETARDLFIQLSSRFSRLGGGRNAALGRTLAEHAEDLAGYQPADLAQAYRSLAQAYTNDPPGEGEIAWQGRAATVKEISIEIDSRVGPVESHRSLELWEDLLRGVERRREAAPEHERARYDAILLTMRYERRLLGEMAGEGDAGPYPRRGGFTPRSGPSNPSPASFAG